MVKIFMCGVGGSGKTTLAKEMMQLKCFKQYRQIKEVAREIMKMKGITKEMLETSEDIFLRLQEMIIEEQRRQEELQKNNSFISDRSVLDCLAYILLKKGQWQDVEQVIQSYEVCLMILKFCLGFIYKDANIVMNSFILIPCYQGVSDSLSCPVPVIIGGVGSTLGPWIRGT